MQLKEGTFIFDCEGDGLTPTKIHCLALETSEGSFETTDYEEMRSALLNAKVLIGHNIIRWDIPQLERLLGIKITARLIDTLALSWALFPNRSNHGLGGWGVSFGIQKPEVEDWGTDDVEVYLNRSREDVRINVKLWGYILQKCSKIYENGEDLDNYIDYLSFKMHCGMLQEQNGWRLDTEYASSALEKLVEEQEAKVLQLASVMPKVPVYKTMTRPKVFTKKGGSLSKLAEDWLNRLKELGHEPDTTEITVLSGYDDPNPNSPSQIKDWLFSLGWKPDTFKQNDKGIEVPQINKEPQKGGGVTDSVKKLFETEPKLEVLDGLSVLNSRVPVLRSFLGSIDDRGKLKAGVAGFTNTLRLRHGGLVNLPRVDRLYAAEIRGSLVADEGCILAGSDLTSLEDKLKQSFIYPHDPVYVREMDIPGYDPHLSLGISAGAITEEQSNKYKDETDKSIKPIRDIYKNGNYACQYNARPKTIARTCGVTIAKGKEIFDAYWKKNWAIKVVAAEQQTKTIISNGEEEMWLKNPINNFWYSLRKDDDRFSTLVQGTASYVFDVWVGFILQEVDTLIGQFHDEIILQVKPQDKEYIEDLINKSMDKTNNMLKLNKVLQCKTQFSERYSEIH